MEMDGKKIGNAHVSSTTSGTLGRVASTRTTIFWQSIYKVGTSVSADADRRGELHSVDREVEIIGRCECFGQCLRRRPARPTGVRFVHTSDE